MPCFIRRSRITRASSSMSLAAWISFLGYFATPPESVRQCLRASFTSPSISAWASKYVIRWLLLMTLLVKRSLTTSASSLKRMKQLLA